MNIWQEYPEWNQLQPLIDRDWKAILCGSQLACASRFQDHSGQPLLTFTLNRHYKTACLFPRRIYTELWKRLPNAESGPDLKDIQTAQHLLTDNNICDFLIAARFLRLTQPQQLPLYFNDDGLSAKPTKLCWTMEGFQCSANFC